MKKIIKFTQQGFCYGVKRSIDIVQKAIDNKELPRPLYLLGDLVHNHEVNDYFLKQGVIVLNTGLRMDMIETISFGTVIFTAHGVSEKIYEKAKQKQLTIIDATCPYVKATVEEIKLCKQNNQAIIYIGKTNHPETETIISDIPGVIIINDLNNIPKLDNQNYVLCHQTTLSDYDVEHISEEIKKRNKNISLLKQVCIFPEKRQQEILKYHYISKNSIILVIGDNKSNNATKLVELIIRMKKVDVQMISTLDELNRLDLSKYDYIYIASGTSTPVTLVEEIYKKLGETYEINA